MSWFVAKQRFAHVRRTATLRSGLFLWNSTAVRNHRRVAHPGIFTHIYKALGHGIAQISHNCFKGFMQYLLLHMFCKIFHAGLYFIILRKCAVSVLISFTLPSCSPRPSLLLHTESNPANPDPGAIKSRWESFRNVYKTRWAMYARTVFAFRDVTDFLSKKIGLLRYLGFLFALFFLI